MKYPIVGKYKHLYCDLDEDIYKLFRKHNVRINAQEYPSGNTYRCLISSLGTLPICKVKDLVHRVVWEVKTGNKPEFIIDHLDNNGLNNTFMNLRISNHLDNRLKVPQALSNTKTGIRGVSLNSRGKYVLSLWKNNKSYRIAQSTDKEFLGQIYDYIQINKYKVVNYEPNILPLLTLKDIEDRLEYKYFNNLKRFMSL